MDYVNPLQFFLQDVILRGLRPPLQFFLQDVIKEYSYYVGGEAPPHSNFFLQDVIKEYSYYPL
jgi:hypothetical protein